MQFTHVVHCRKYYKVLPSMHIALWRAYKQST